MSAIGVIALITSIASLVYCVWVERQSRSLALRTEAAAQRAEAALKRTEDARQRALAAVTNKRDSGTLVS